MTFQFFKPCVALLICLPHIVLASEFGASKGASLGVGVNLSEQQILPVDEAFDLNTVRRGGKLEVLWQIQPGHYLYRHRLAVKGSDNLGEPIIPSGLPKVDEYFGDVEVYYDALVVEVPLAGEAPEEITVEYQGCSEVGICYPPQKRVIEL